MPKTRRWALQPVLELVDVHAGYGRVEVLRGVNLVVPPGALVSLVGSNGVGKTTTLRTIAGLLRPRRGKVLLDGRSTAGRRPFEIAAAGVCLIPEGRGVFPSLTVRENLTMQAPAGRRDAANLERVLDYFPRLRERLGQKAGTLSGGEQQMLSMARALMSEPRVLLLDEISMGLAPQIVAQLFETVEALARSGMSILMVEQYLSYALKLSDVIYVMSKGCVSFVGEPEEIRANASVEQLAYGGA